MNKTDFIAVMEQIAPPELAMSFDNVGLLVDNGKGSINKVMLALDCTTITATEAAKWGADMLMTHHPQMLDGIKRISATDPSTAGIYMLIQNGISLYAAHTNLDIADGGVNDCMVEILGLVDVKKYAEDKIGRIGSLLSDMPLASLAKLVEAKFNTSVRICGSPDRIVRRVALIGGAGGFDIANAKKAGADVFITGELKHDQALEALQLGLCIIQAGHYETEHIVLEPLIKRLQKQTFDVEYKLALSEYSCLSGI